MNELNTYIGLINHTYIAEIEIYISRLIIQIFNKTNLNKQTTWKTLEKTSTLLQI